MKTNAAAMDSADKTLMIAGLENRAEKNEQKEKIMEAFELRDADAALLEQIAALAETIWHEHYESILGLDQVNYMVEHFQSLPAMQDQIASQGYRYRGVFWQGKLCGYVATAWRPEHLFLSKLYLKAEVRGLGLASRVLSCLKNEAKEGTGKIQLTVNRFNADSLAVYRKWGFVTLREEKNSIGGGYYMDDYIMELDCSQ